MESRGDDWEAYVRQRVAAGEIADFISLPNYQEGSKPKLQAAFLRRLMLGLEEVRVPAPGVRIRGAALAGILDLQDCTGLGALALEHCELPDLIDISGAELVRFSIDDSAFSAVSGTGVRIGGDFTFRNARPVKRPEGTDATCYIRLRNARIAGVVSGRGASLIAPEEHHPLSGRQVDALELTSAQIGGSVLLDQCTPIEGAIWLLNARIQGNLSISENIRIKATDGIAIVAQDAEINGSVQIGDDAIVEGETQFKGARIGGTFNLGMAKLRNPGGDALFAPNLKVGGDLLMLDEFEAEGRTLIVGAVIGGGINCTASKFTNPNGDALDATNAQVGGDVYLHSQFEAQGRVLLHGGKIGGNIEFGDCSLSNPDGEALLAANVKVGGDVLMTDGSKFTGRVNFQSAEISRDFFLKRCTITAPEQYALRLGAADISGQLMAWDNDITGAVDLEGAHARRLLDDPETAWGADRQQQIDLNEFSYDLIGVAPRAKRPIWKHRIAWLRRNCAQAPHGAGAFSNHPYRELAAALERAGFQSDARRIARAEQSEANRHRPFWQRPIVWLFAELPFGYGLSVSRAVITIVAFWLAGWLGVHLMLAQGALILAGGEARCTGAISAPLYALDVALPIIDLGQASTCTVGAAEGAHLFPGFATPYGLLANGLTLWRWATALYSLLGTVVVGFAALTFTGIFKPRGA